MFDEAIDKLKDELIRSLCTNIRIQSDAQPPEPGKPNGPGAAHALEHALRTARQLGFRTKEVDGYAGYAEYGEGEEMVAVLGHLDVVPAGDGWKHPPFAGIIEDGKIYGRGTVDDKGPIFAALYGLKAVMDSGRPLSRRIRIIFGVIEETGCSDMEYYVNKEELPVSGFTPDASFPVIHAEKGVLNVTFAKEFSPAESAFVALESLSGGNAVNMVPDKARAVLRLNGRRAELNTVGKSAHGSRPDLGVNACFPMLDLLSRQDLPLEMQDSFAYLAYALGQETRGENLGIACTDEISGPLVVNLGLLEGDKGHIRGSLNIRYPVSADKDKLLAGLSASFAKGGFLIESFSHLPPINEPVDSPLVKTLCRVFAEKTGQNLPPAAIGGASYARSMPHILAFGPQFPQEEDLCHQPNEFISVDRLVLLAKIYAQAMYELAK